MITSAGLFDKSSLASLALKLSPQLTLLLQAYVVPVAPAGAPPSPPQEVFAWSRHTAQANAWYHIAIVSSGSELSLHVNGMVEASIPFEGWLATPQRKSDGDVTFGCGMHEGKLADTCSCLLSEVRASDQALPSKEWLWSPDLSRV